MDMIMDCALPSSFLLVPHLPRSPQPPLPMPHPPPAPPSPLISLRALLISTLFLAPFFAPTLHLPTTLCLPSSSHIPPHTLHLPSLPPHRPPTQPSSSSSPFPQRSLFPPALAFPQLTPHLPRPFTPHYLLISPPFRPLFVRIATGTSLWRLCCGFRR
ncbi:unnamed protein product [Closterium sp. NIES-64]|nr:unnamed protein product [Closterium sp. NIES-64]